MSKEKTAVEYLIERIRETNSLTSVTMNLNGDFDKAREMEREQKCPSPQESVQARISSFSKVSSKHCLYDNYAKGWSDCYEWIKTYGKEEK